MSGELLLPAGTTDVLRTADGADLALTVLGDGPDVVLAHGWTEHRQVWAPVARRLLERGHRVVLYDQRGHASSTCGRDGFTIAALGDDLRAVLEHVDATDAVLAGHSMGGMTILSLADRHPDVLAARASGLALVATAASGLGAPRLDGVGPKVLGSGWLEALYRSPAGPLLMRRTVGKVARREHLHLSRDMFLASTREARAGWLAAMLAMDQRACLPAIEVPTVVVVGTRDHLTPPHLAAALVDAVPGARLVSLDERGHQLPLEAADEVADVIARLAEGEAP